ncbi:hypothetical protein AAULR_07096, partial [Lacticaseibacillus rhamnosus MTCC 5462]
QELDFFFHQEAGSSLFHVGGNTNVRSMLTVSGTKGIIDKQVA